VHIGHHLQKVVLIGKVKMCKKKLKRLNDVQLTCSNLSEKLGGER
jgi:hypothetical protein